MLFTCVLVLGKTPGGALNFFFGGCVPHGFPKVGSRERIFLEKLGGLGNENLENLRLESWNFDQNKAENGKFFYNLKMRGIRAAQWL